MNRQLVSREELLQILNKRIMAHPDGGPDCSMPGPVYELKDPDAEGVNWEVTIVRGSGIEATECAKAFRRVIAEARKAYNLERLR